MKNIDINLFHLLMPLNRKLEKERLDLGRINILENNEFNWILSYLPYFDKTLDAKNISIFKIFPSLSKSIFIG